MKKTEKAKEVNYQELEDKLKDIIAKLDDENLPLDEAGKLYQEGKDTLKEMDAKLKELSSQVKDEVDEGE